MKTKIQLSTGIISLAALLVYTLAHTGALLGRFSEWLIVGYTAALGIELAIVSLSIRIGELRRSQQDARFFYFVLVAVVIVSAIANIAEGFRVSEGVKLTLSTVQQLDIVQGIIGLVATGLISLIVLALSEIVGTDVTQTVKIVEKEAKRQAKSDKSSVFVPGDLSALSQARQARTDRMTDRQQQVLAMRQDGLSDADIATALDVSVRTVRRDVKALNGSVK